MFPNRACKAAEWELRPHLSKTHSSKVVREAAPIRNNRDFSKYAMAPAALSSQNKVFEKHIAPAVRTKQEIDYLVRFWSTMASS